MKIKIYILFESNNGMIIVNYNNRTNGVLEDIFNNLKN